MLGHPAAGQDTNPALLAPQAGQTGAAVDGISSSATEQVLFHIHSHLRIYVNGAPKLIPYGIGIVAPYDLTGSRDGPFVSGGKAFYWLHTHRGDPHRVPGAARLHPGRLLRHVGPAAEP